MLVRVFEPQAVGTQDYLRDTHHPNDWFLNNVLNIYINLFHDHQAAATRRSASP